MTRVDITPPPGYEPPVLAFDKTAPGDIEDVKRLSLSPDDTLVIRLAGSLSMEEARRLREQVRALTAHDRVLILDHSAELTVVTPDGDPDPDG
jgi:hypothetical protein